MSNEFGWLLYNWNQIKVSAVRFGIEEANAQVMADEFLWHAAKAEPYKPRLAKEARICRVITESGDEAIARLPDKTESVGLILNALTQDWDAVNDAVGYMAFKEDYPKCITPINDNDGIVSISPNIWTTLGKRCQDIASLELAEEIYEEGTSRNIIKKSKSKNPKPQKMSKIKPYLKRFDTLYTFDTDGKLEIDLDIVGNGLNYTYVLVKEREDYALDLARQTADEVMSKFIMDAVSSRSKSKQKYRTI